MPQTNIARAFAYLDAHSVYEKTGRIDSPSTANIERLVQLLGDPHLAYRTIHVTGTNGKGSTSQMITKLLMAHGLRVGTYTSPHLERVNERMMLNGEPISDDELSTNVLAIADLEPLVGTRLSYFEVMTAVAFRWFADSAVDVGVIEVGLLGRWDATNVVQSDVAVLTNVSLDHTEFAGPTHAHIAREKVGIVKPGSVFVQGETRPELEEIFANASCQRRVVRNRHFELSTNELAVGGRLVDVRTTRARMTQSSCRCMAPTRRQRRSCHHRRRGILRARNFASGARRGIRLGHDAWTIRGDRSPAARHRRRRAQRWRGGGVLRRVLQRLPSGRSSRIGGRHAEESRAARVAGCAACGRIRPSGLLHGSDTARHFCRNRGGRGSRSRLRRDRRRRPCGVGNLDCVPVIASEDALLVAGSLYVVGAARPVLRGLVP